MMNKSWCFAFRFKKLIQKKLKIFFIGVISTMLWSCTSETSKKKRISAELGAWKPIEINLLGANANLISFDAPWDNDRLVDITRKTGIKTLRYPGGTIGNYWDWDIGAIDRNVPDSLMIKWVVTNDLRERTDRYTLENLAKMYQKTGIVPVFMLNMLSKDLQHSVRNLKKAKSLGIPIKYIEMGNELYFNIPFPLLRYPTPEVYGDTCQIWITALKKEFHDASFAVIGTDMTRHARQVNWNKRVLDRCKNADALVIHMYSPSGLDGRLERKKIKPGKEGLGETKTATRVGPKEIEERQQWELGLLKDKKAYSNMFTTADKSLKKIDDFYVPNDIDLWVTEFNIRDDNSVVLHSWAQTLILSKYLFKFLEKDIELSNMHNLSGKLFGMVHTDSLSYEHLSIKNIKSLPYTLSSGGAIMSLFGEVMSDMEDGTTLNFENSTNLNGDRGEQTHSLQGHLFKNEERKTAIIVNYSLVEQEVMLNNLGEKAGEMVVYSSKPSDPVIGLNYTINEALDYGQPVTLAPHSIAIFKFQNE